MSIRSSDICDQSLKLSEIALNFGRFLPSQILVARSLKKLYPNCTCLAAHHAEKFDEESYRLLQRSAGWRAESGD